MKFERVQELAKALGWAVYRFADDWYYLYDQPSGCGGNVIVSHEADDYPIRKRLAEEYRRRAKTAQVCLDLARELDGRNGREQSQMWAKFTSIAEELEAVEEPNEPTIVEKLRQKREGKHDPFGQHLILDALIDLYERKDSL